MQKIIVHNFGPIQKATIELKGLTVLIGEQACGKSTIAKLIYFFKTFKNDLFNLVRYDSQSVENPSDREALVERVKSDLQNKFNIYFDDIDKLAEDYSLEFYYLLPTPNFLYPSIIVETKISISGKPLKISFDENTINTIKNLGGSILTSNGYSRTTNFKAFEVFDRELKNYLNLRFNDNYEPLYIPAGRNISVSYPQEFKDFFLSGKSLSGSTPQKTIDRELMQAFIGRVSTIQDRFNNTSFQQLSEKPYIYPNRIKKAVELITLVLKGTYSNKGGIGEGIEPIGSHLIIPIYQASSGQQEALRILQDIFLCLLDRKSVFRIIEEPEAHLFPKAQSQIMQLFSLLIGSGDSNQVLITTHSPYILSYLNNLLFAWKIGHIDPEAENKIAVESRLNPENFGAYVLRNGNSQSIFNTETGLIDHNYLDEIFEEIGFEYDALYDVYADYITSNGSH